VQDFLKAAAVLEVTQAVAEKFGERRAGLLDRGLVVGELDLLNASIALIHNLALVTHNVADYANVPGLTLVDWQIP
jgi:tRNA(fMet)-specific endonuclease VapC